MTLQGQPTEEAVNRHAETRVQDGKSWRERARTEVVPLEKMDQTGRLAEIGVEVRMEGSGAEDAAVATGRPLASPGGDV